jgi:hypothetical protein
MMNERHTVSLRRRWLIVWLLALMVWAPASARAENGAVEVLENSVSTRFAESSVFHLAAYSDTPIQEVAILYRVGDSVVTNRAYPTFTPGRDIDVQWTLEHFPGSLPPGSEVSYYWLLWDAAGRETRLDSSSFVYNDDRFDWSEIGEGPFRVFTYSGDQGRRLLDIALANAITLEEEIGVALTRPVRIYVYANRSDMRQALPSRSDRYDEMTVTLGMVVAGDTLLLLGNASNVEQTLAHELSHIVVGLATDNPISDLPRWLDEGLAMYAERELPANNQLALDRAIRRDELISVRSLSGYSGDPDLVDLFYAESYSVISYMLDEYGRDKMLELLTEFSGGVYQEDALVAVYGFGLDELDARWREHLGMSPRNAPAQSAPEPAASPDDTVGSPLCIGLLPGMLSLVCYIRFRPRDATH